MAFRRATWIFLFEIAAFTLGCKQRTSQPPARQQIATAASVVPSQIAPAAPATAASVESPSLKDVEVRKGPFSIAGQTFFVLLHYKELADAANGESQTLASIEIANAAGEVQHREPFQYSVEGKDFSETCTADAQFLAGNSGQGLLLDVGCLPSAPLSGGPWEIFGVVNGKLTPIGKPLVTEGELGNFVPGAINRIGTASQILPDTLQVRVWTGYFFVSIPVRVNWLQGKLELAQHCFYQTGHGFAEGGCEMPVEEVQRSASDQDLTFVRLFPESSEDIGPPAHIVVKKESQVEILAAKVMATWDEGTDNIGLGVGDDIWIKVRIDGKEGWIHTVEDLNAIGLYQSG